MDYDRALRKVEEYLNICNQAILIQDRNPNGYHRDQAWIDLIRLMTEKLPLVEKIAREIDPRLVDTPRKDDYIIEGRYKAEACQELRGAILGRQDVEEILGPQGPQLAAAQLHPWVWDHAANLWSDGHRRSAVQAAATGLFDSHIPAKLGRQRETKKGGKDLMGQAFSDKPPEQGAPRRRFTDITEGTPEWTSAHDGAMKLGQGAAQAIRNLATHDPAEPDEQDALEMLAVLSYRSEERRVG